MTSSRTTRNGRCDIRRTGPWTRGRTESVRDEDAVRAAHRPAPGTATSSTGCRPGGRDCRAPEGHRARMLPGPCMTGSRTARAGSAAGAGAGPAEGEGDVRSVPSGGRGRGGSLADRLRIAGTTEFPGPDEAAVPRPMAIVDAVRPFLRGVDLDDRHDEWVGSRPCTPDGLPLVEPTTSPRVFVTGGHGTAGLVFSGRASPPRPARPAPDCGRQSSGRGKWVSPNVCHSTTSWRSAGRMGRPCGCSTYPDRLPERVGLLGVDHVPDPPGARRGIPLRIGFAGQPGGSAGEGVAVPVPLTHRDPARLDLVDGVRDAVDGHVRPRGGRCW